VLLELDGRDDDLLDVVASTRHQIVDRSHEQSTPDQQKRQQAFSQIQTIATEDVPLIPLWQGKQYIAARDDITGVEWALNSASVLQLWELSRGVGS